MTAAEKLFITLYLFASTNLLGYGQRQTAMASPLVEKPAIVAPAAPTATPVPTATPTPAKIWHGLASYYSKSGCIGCSPTLTTASGEKLDDNKLTLAVTPEMVKNHKLMGKYVLVTNTKNKKSVMAKINDTGGFSKYGRIADLNLATKNAIDCSDLCMVMITL